MEKGVFGYVSEHWGNDVKCFYLQQPDKERKKAGWQVESYANVRVEQISSDVFPRQFVSRVITEYPNAIHIFFGGLIHKLKKYLDSYIDQVKDSKLVIVAEKPLVSGKLKLLKKIAKKLLYRIIFKNYNPYIDVFLAMGQKGVNRYKEYGYSKNSIFPFMYNPIMNINDNNKSIDKIIVNNPVRFLYLGRFDFKYKGCKNLMIAFDNIDKELNGKWKLTLVGGYGKQKNEIIEWANNKEFVDFGGTWNQKDIIKNMSDYDICIVPSIEDGWNLSPNYAIYSHVGMIISDEATSHEIIENSGSGIVYHYNDIDSFKKHIEDVIRNRDMIYQWKLKTFQFVDKISSKSVGDYFIDIMDYSFYNSNKLPKCPWLKQE
ncbi:MAG: glycosyltransferase [Paludibacteraceae bacterium]|nr:glycosyltransferase [Paludibacteraceae bacterium]